MILETADLSVTPGHDAAFEAGVLETVPLLMDSQGRRRMRLHRVMGTSSLYRLLADWDRLEDHSLRLRNSDAFSRRRALVSPDFAAPPSATHSEEALSSECG